MNLFQSSPELVDLLLTLFADDFLVGRAEYEDHPARNLLPALRVMQLVPHLGHVVMFLGELASHGTSPLLFNRQIGGGFPPQGSALRVKQRLKFVPGSGTNGLAASGPQAQQMPDRERAPIGNHRHLRERQILLPQSELFGHGSASVLIAVDRVPEKRQGAELIHMRAHPCVNHQRAVRRIIGCAARRNVRRPQSVVATNRAVHMPGLARHGILVGAAQQNVHGVVMHFAQRHFEFTRYVQRDHREDRMPLSEKGVERATQPVVIDLFDRHVPENVSARLRGPRADIAQSHWTKQSRGNQQAEHVSVRELRLAIRRKMSVDNFCHVHPFEQRHDQRQRSEVAPFDGRRSSKPSEAHAPKSG